MRSRALTKGPSFLLHSLFLVSVNSWWHELTIPFRVSLFSSMVLIAESKIHGQKVMAWSNHLRWSCTSRLLSVLSPHHCGVPALCTAGPISRTGSREGYHIIVQLVALIFQEGEKMGKCVQGDMQPWRTDLRKIGRD